MKKYLSPFALLPGLLLMVPFLTIAQPEKSNVRSGNKAYQKNNFSEAEIKYRKALEKNHSSFNANYNLGNALYKQDKFEEASRQFSAAANLAPDKNLAARDYHNLGNSYFRQQKFNESIEAYKNALRLNPNDDETRYNLAYAQKMLKQQEKNQQGKNKNEQDKNQNQDKNKNENQQNKEQQQDEQQNQQQNADNQQGQPKQPEQKISKEDAERLLQALRNNEKEIQKRLNKIEGQRIRTEKQW